MRAKWTRAAQLAALACLAAAPAAAQTWSATVPAGGSGAVQSSDLKRTPPNQVTDAAAATVKVTCQAPADCSRLKLQLRNAQGATIVDLGRIPAGSNDFALPASALQAGQTANLVFLLPDASGQDQLVDSFQVTGGPPPVGPPPAGTEPTLAQLLTIDCPSAGVTVGYDAANNLGEILVTPTGQVLGRGIDTFDENDTLKVIIYGDQRLLSTLKVERISAFRDAQTVRIVGAGLTVPEGLRQAAPVANCTTLELTLAEFAPGQGKVQISSFQDKDWVPLGTFDFQVDPLYTGILSLGAARTNLVDPSFKIASNGTENVVALGDEGDDDVLYALFYTPYVWGKRDLEKKIPLRRWYKRLNPSFGIVPDDVTDNVLAGITIDLPAGFLFTYGWHFRRVTVLPEETGLTVGSPFAGETLPTAKEWEDDTFLSLTVDLRAMVQLFTAALGGGGGS